MAAPPIVVERVLVTGSRDWIDRPILERELLHELMLSAHNNRIMLRVPGAEAYLTHAGALSCVHFVLGDCQDGADFLARKWCERYKVSHEVHVAARVRSVDDYDEIVRANHARNQAMVTTGNPSRFVAFWEGRIKPSGTCDTMARCTVAGIPGRTVPMTVQGRQLKISDFPRLTNFESPRRGPNGDEDSG